MKTSFTLDNDHIELFKLLKLEGIASTGGEAKAMISAGSITVNGQVELRKRNKVRVGDVVAFEDTAICVVGANS